MKDKFLTSADASKVLGITLAAVRLNVIQRRLKVSAKTEGEIRLFRRSDVERLAKRRANSRRAAEVTTNEET